MIGRVFWNHHRENDQGQAEGGHRGGHRHHRGHQRDPLHHEGDRELHHQEDDRGPTS